MATPATEREWLEAARGKTVRQLERLVSGKAPGDRPSDAGRPETQRHILRFDVSAQTYATFREAAALIRRRSAEPMNDDALLLQVAREILRGPSDAGRSSYQISVTVCERCQRGVQHAAGANVELPPEIVEMMRCDAQFVGGVATRVDTEGDGAQSEELCSVERRRLAVERPFRFADETFAEGPYANAQLAEKPCANEQFAKEPCANAQLAEKPCANERFAAKPCANEQSAAERVAEGHSGDGRSGDLRSDANQPGADDDPQLPHMGEHDFAAPRSTAEAALPPEKKARSKLRNVERRSLGKSNGSHVTTHPPGRTSTPSHRQQSGDHAGAVDAVDFRARHDSKTPQITQPTTTPRPSPHQQRPTHDP
ncbi:MAG: hypothetical protein DIU78_023135 [Pseudomonadota bacterium]